MVCLSRPLMPPFQLFHLSLAAGFLGSSAPFAFGKMFPIAEIGLGPGALDCLAALSLSLIHVIQNSLQPACSGHPGWHWWFSVPFSLYLSLILSVCPESLPGDGLHLWSETGITCAPLCHHPWQLVSAEAQKSGEMLGLPGWPPHFWCSAPLSFPELCHYAPGSGAHVCKAQRHSLSLLGRVSVLASAYFALDAENGQICKWKCGKKNHDLYTCFRLEGFTRWELVFESAHV